MCNTLMYFISPLTIYESKYTMVALDVYEKKARQQTNYELANTKEMTGKGQDEKREIDGQHRKMT